MSVTDVVNIIEKASEAFGTLPPTSETILKDSEILPKLEGLKSEEVVDKVTEHLKREGRPGSAEYIEVLADSAHLDKQLELLEKGTLNHESLEKSDIQLLVDSGKTTPEMIAAGQVMLLPEAKENLLGGVHSIKRKIDGHIRDTVQKASSIYAAEIAKRGVGEDTVRRLLETPANQGEIPFLPTEVEIEALANLQISESLSVEEAYALKLQEMMTQDPRMIGLEATSSTSRYMSKLTEELGGKSGEPTNINGLRRLHTQMNQECMDELGIHHGFANAVEDAVGRDYKTIASEAKVEAKGEVVYTQGEWLVGDIDQQTKEWLLGGPYESVQTAFTPEEQTQAREFANRMYVGKGAETPLLQGEPQAQQQELNRAALSMVEANEDDNEAMKLLLRIAIKVGTKIAVSIAKEIAKDKNTPPEVRIALGLFTDAATSGGKIAEALITGEDHPDLQRDCIQYVLSRRGSKTSS